LALCNMAIPSLVPQRHMKRAQIKLYIFQIQILALMEVVVSFMLQPF
jgi:hypothetical protein